MAVFVAALCPGHGHTVPGNGHIEQPERGLDLFRGIALRKPACGDGFEQPDRRVVLHLSGIM